jgi:hypothetical protein
MNNQTDDRKILVLHRSVEDSVAIATALQERLVLELFNSEGRLMRLQDGVMQTVTAPALMQLINQHLVTVRLAYDGERHVPELCDLALDRQMLVDTTNKLLSLVVQVKSSVRKLSTELLSQIRARCKVAEPYEAIARYYSITAAEVRQIAAAAPG